MKEITKISVSYGCETCGKIWARTDQAEKCELRHVCKHPKFTYRDAYDNWISRFCFDCDKALGKVCVGSLQKEVFNFIVENHPDFYQVEKEY